MAIQDVKIYLSGGQANSDAGLSLGGEISTTRVLSQNVTGLTMGGVAIEYATDNVVGAGTLTYTLSGQLLKWASYGNTAGTDVAVGGGGSFLLKSNNSTGDLVVTITPANLPVANTTNTLTVSNYQNRVFDDQASLQVFNGHIDYRCLYLKNTGAVTENNIKVWITQPIGASTIMIGLDAAGVGDGINTGVAQTVANELTAPTGFQFVNVTTQLTGLTVTQLTPGQAFAFWIKRSITAGDRAAVSEVAKINYSAFT